MNEFRLKLYNLFENDIAYDRLTGTWHDRNIVIGTTDEFDETSLPNEYILLRYDVSNITSIFGDGNSLQRKSDCDIMLVSEGIFPTSLEELECFIEDLLNNNEISFLKINLGYDKITKQTQTTYSITLRT